MLREISSREPKAGTARPEQFVDTSFVRELDTSEFIDRLYKRPALARREEPSPAVPSVKAKTASTEQKTKVAAITTSSLDKKGEIVSWVSKPSHTSPDNNLIGHEYTIKAGDKLSKLAEQFYGAQWKWGKIYEANRRTMSNPHFISSTLGRES
jgi:nucleoid-associated protein YgaU